MQVICREIFLYISSSIEPHGHHPARGAIGPLGAGTQNYPVPVGRYFIRDIVIIWTWRGNFDPAAMNVIGILQHNHINHMRTRSRSIMTLFFSRIYT
jgi:hypothetical protein